MTVFVSIVICILLALLAVCAAIYKMAFYSDRKPRPGPNIFPEGDQFGRFTEPVARNMHWLDDCRSENVEITSFDGLTLRGRYFRNDPEKPVAIMFHGYRSAALRDASGGGPYLYRKGYNVLLVDQRAHCASEGRNITFGVKERLDCRAWIEYIIRSEGPDVRIMLAGVSMGAATVLMAGDTGLPANVRGILADCPFSAPEEIILRVAKSMHFPAGLIKPFVRLTAKAFAGFDLNGSTAVSAVRKIHAQVLLVHGADDDFVPCEMSRRIAAANPEFCRLVEIAGAGHAMSFYINMPEYLSELDKLCTCVEE